MWPDTNMGTKTEILARNYYNKGASCSGKPAYSRSLFRRPRWPTLSREGECFTGDSQGRRPGHRGPPSLCPAPPLPGCKQPHPSCLGPVFSLTQTSPASKGQKPRARLVPQNEAPQGTSRQRFVAAPGFVSQGFGQGWTGCSPPHVPSLPRLGDWAAHVDGEEAGDSGRARPLEQVQRPGCSGFAPETLQNVNLMTPQARSI